MLLVKDTTAISVQFAEVGRGYGVDGGVVGGRFYRLLRFQNLLYDLMGIFKLLCLFARPNHHWWLHYEKWVLHRLLLSVPLHFYRRRHLRLPLRIIPNMEVPRLIFWQIRRLLWFIEPKTVVDIVTPAPWSAQHQALSAAGEYLYAGSGAVHHGLDLGLSHLNSACVDTLLILELLVQVEVQ